MTGEVDEQFTELVREEAISYSSDPMHSYFVKANHLDIDEENTLIGRALKQTEADIWSNAGGNYVFDVRPLLDEIEE